jgi:amidase
MNMAAMKTPPAINSPILNGDGSVPAWEYKVAQKRRQCWEAIPASWRLSQTHLELLKLPLDRNKNNIIEMGVPRKCGILNKNEIRITEEYTVAQLLEELRSGQLTATDVTIAFSKRAAIAHQLVRCSKAKTAVKIS